MEKFIEVLRCPQTKNRLVFDSGQSLVRVLNTGQTYPIRDGIVDFLPGVTDRISTSYDSITTFYDEYITLSNLRWKMIGQITWGFGDNDPCIQKVLSFIPDDFDGYFLDVPVGTGIFTFEIYQKLKNAKIIALDYTLGMVRKSQEIYASHGIHNVIYVRGDVGALPVADSCIDFCLSMNGLHAFPDKPGAIGEIRRVTKDDARLAGCFYIRGKRALTDLLVKYALSRSGTFTPPFYSEEETRALLGRHFNIETGGHFKSFFYFNGKAGMDSLS